ncbi:BTAD domain-containing putative transcriptional regulator [Streptomyces sp. WSLK1-3]|uniref:BTAD domain-containing putative transcriptional regulator n=1 Tax=Streptomyces sp. WSLK1-3 TaxID=3375475 RepID=UPI0037B3BE70
MRADATPTGALAPDRLTPETAPGRSAAAGAEAGQAVRFQVLGPVRVWRAGLELDLGFPQQRALLALLLAHAGRPVPTGEILDTIWAERPPASALNVIRRYVGSLRRLLEPGLPLRAPGRRLLRRPGGYLLAAAADEVDLLRLRELTRQGKQAAAAGRLERATDCFTRALGEWRGPVAMGIPASAREHVQFTALARELLDTARLAADSALLCGRAEQALPVLRQAGAHDPLDEPLHARLVLSLAACGLQAEALKAYDDIRRRLRQELGVAPGAELAAAHTRVLRQDVRRLTAGPVVELGRKAAVVRMGAAPLASPPVSGSSTLPSLSGSLASPPVSGSSTLPPASAPLASPPASGSLALPPPSAPLTSPSLSGSSTLPPASAPLASPSLSTPLESPPRSTPPLSGPLASQPPSAPPQPTPYPRPAQLPPGLPVFAGRKAELDWLTQVAGTGPQAAGAARAVLIRGMPGVGKSTLAVHWAHQTANRFPDGQLYVALGGFEPTRPVVEPADALRGMLAALGVSAPHMPHGLAALSGLYRRMLAGRRALVLLDDAVDAEQVRPLLPTAPGCLALVTSRNALPGLTASGVRPLRLEPPSVEDARETLALRLGNDRLDAEPRAAAEIVARCGRLPLALAVVAARAVSRRDFPLAAVAAELGAAQGTLDALPAVRAAFLSSYGILSPESAQLFRLLARPGVDDISAAAVATLARLSARETGPLLGELAEGHLLTEAAPGRYALHDLLRALAVELAEEDGRPDDF